MEPGVANYNKRLFRSIYRDKAEWAAILASYIATDSNHNFVTDAQIAAWNSATAISHARLHAINSTSDHQSSILPTYVMVADTNGLPSQGTNTNAQIASAVSLSHTQNTDTGTTSSSFIVDSDSVLGKIVLSATPGAANKSLTLTNTALTDDRIATFQNASGTVAYLSDIVALTHKVKVSAADTTEDYLNPKISSGTGISTSIINPAGNEQLQIINTDTGSSAVAAHNLAFDHALLHTQNTDTGTTATTFTVDSDATLGKIAITVAAGAANKILTLTNTALTDDRVATFQDASGTVAYLSDIPSGAGLWSSGGAGWIAPTTITNNVGINSTVAPVERFDIKQGNINFVTVPNNTSAPTVANSLVAGGVTAGDHRYMVIFYCADGSYTAATTYASITAPGAKQVDISNIPISADVNVIGRKILRTKATSPTAYYYLLTTIADNSTTVYTDTTSDAGLGALLFYSQSYPVNTTAGTLKIDSTIILRVNESNTSIGYGALDSNTGGFINVAIGDNALTANTTGQGNTAIGSDALLTNTTGNENTAIGKWSLRSLLDGTNNMGVGRAAGYYNVSGAGNTLVGFNAGYGVSTKSYNYCVYVGCNAGQYSIGPGNVYVGYQAGATTASSANNLNQYNVGIGYQSMYSISGTTPISTNSQNNVAIGRQSCYSTTTGSYNCALGTYALYYNITGKSNVALGERALYGVASGGAWANNMVGSIAVGYYSGAYSLGNYNIYIGYESGMSTSAVTSTNLNNIGIGYQSLYSITTSAATKNTSVGYQALYTQTTLANNIALGAYAGKYENTAGNKLYIDGLDRSTEAAGKTNSIIYGVMDATVTNQNLYVNAHLHTMSDSLYHYFGGGDDMSIYYNGTNGYINTSLVAASDLYISCGTDKTLVLTESVWEDLQFKISNGRVGLANYPDWDTFTTNTGEYKFDVNDYIDLGAEEMPHSWKESTTVKPHIHFTTDGANSSGGNQYVKCTLYIAYADDDAVWTETTSTVELTIPNGTADMKNLFGTGTDVSFAGLTIGTQVKIRIKRIAATAGTEYPNHIFITQCGLHVEMDTMGSRQVGTK